MSRRLWLQHQVGEERSRQRKNTNSTVQSPSGVRHAAVKAWKDDSGRCRLAAYVTPSAASVDAVFSHCRTNLLPAMMPAVVLPLPALPRLPNGKTDIKSLPEPDWEALLGGERGKDAIALPLTETEILLSGIWASTLGIQLDKLSVDANFFTHLGGTSLKAGLINSSIRRALGSDMS